MSSRWGFLGRTFLQTATSQSAPWRTWKKVTLPSVMSGLVGGVELAMTWILNTSEIDRLIGEPEAG